MQLSGGIVGLMATTLGSVNASRWWLSMPVLILAHLKQVTCSWVLNKALSHTEKHV